MTRFSGSLLAFSPLLITFSLVATLFTPVTATVAAGNGVDQAVVDALKSILQGYTPSSGTPPTTAPPAAPSHPLLQDFRTMEQNVHAAYKTIGNDIMSSAVNLGSTAYGAAYNQLDAVVAAYEAQYCTPAKYTPPTKMFAEFTGHKFELFLSSGKCVVNETLLLEENRKVLDCVDPSVYLVNYPAKFNSKYLAGAQFESKSCKVTKTFGNPIEKVLFVFDGQTPIDINSITNTVVSEVRASLGGLSIAHTNLKDQMSKFLSSLPHLTSPLGTAYANAPSASG